jgi:hypothetical protein
MQRAGSHGGRAAKPAILPAAVDRPWSPRHERGLDVGSILARRSLTVVPGHSRADTEQLSIAGSFVNSRSASAASSGRNSAAVSSAASSASDSPVPVRPWVLSVPKRRRGMLADRPAAIAALTTIFLDEIERLPCAAAGVTRTTNTPAAVRQRRRPAGAGSLRTGGSQAGEGQDGFARVSQRLRQACRPRAGLGGGSNPLTSRSSVGYCSRKCHWPGYPFVKEGPGEPAFSAEKSPPWAAENFFREPFSEAVPPRTARRRGAVQAGC